MLTILVPYSVRICGLLVQREADAYAPVKLLKLSFNDEAIASQAVHDRQLPMQAFSFPWPFRRSVWYNSVMSNSEKALELTVEQEQAVDAHGGVVQGQSFVLMRTDVLLDFFGYDSKEDLRRELQPAFDQADRGELEEWDVDAFLARMHRSHDNKTE